MARPLGEYFRTVYQSDVHSYGHGDVHDFLMPGRSLHECDWIITNPPFRLAKEFIFRSLDIASRGVAMLVRTSFLEGCDRYNTLFSKSPPHIVAPFVERIPMFKGKIDRGGASATSYSWLIWETKSSPLRGTVLRWIPPCRKRLERDSDYPKPPSAAAV